MANYGTLKTAVQTVVKTNGNNEITGALLQQSLLAMINSLGADYQIKGIATQATEPGTPDQNVAYLAGPGTYANFNNAVVPDGCVGVFKYNGSWTIETTEIATGLTEMNDEIQALAGFIKSGRGTSTSASFSKLTTIDNLNIASGQKFYVLVSASPIYTRMIINYNGSNSKRIMDTTDQTRNGVWREYTAPEAITKLGFYYTGSANATVTLVCQIGNTFIPNGAISTDKIADGAVSPNKLADGAITYDKLASELLDKILNTKRTVNLYNDLLIVRGQYINNSGAIMSASGWAMTNRIPVTGGAKYTISCKYSARAVGINWYDSDGNRITSYSASSSIYRTHTAPDNAAYLQFNVAASGNDSTNVMVIAGEQTLPYVPYNQITTDQIKDLADFVKGAASGGEISVTKNGNNVTVSKGSNSISFVLQRNLTNEYGYNPVFNFVSMSYNGVSYEDNDDIAPLHILNTTIGANHGQPAQRANIPSHGLTNTAIGTGWTKDGVTFYVMRIVDADHILFLSANQGTNKNPSFVALTAGTLTRNGASLVVSSVESTYVLPALKNHQIRMVIDGETEITQDGTYICGHLDVVESYDIMHPASIIDNLIARAGQSGDPVFDGDSVVTVETTYRFVNDMAIVVIANIIPRMEIVFSDAMFTQAQKIGDNNTKYYIPNSLPLASGYDFRVPLAVNWSSSVPSLTVSESAMADPTHPASRVLQYRTDNVGFAIGFLTDRGVGANLLTFTTSTFELRNNTGKIYPHGVTSGKVGTALQVGQIYTAVMYRAFFVKPTSGNRLSLYYFDLDGSTYAFVDYSGTMLDKVVIDDNLNGKKITVLDSANTVLKSDVYNGGFYVNATYVSGETCFAVVKIG